MATPIRGCFGVIKAKDTTATGAVATVGGINDWSIEESAEQLDSSEIGTCTKSSVAGANSRTLSISGFSALDGNQGDFTVGNIVDIEIHPGGSGSGTQNWSTTTGGATVLSVSRGGGVDGFVTLSLNLSINGDFTLTTVP